MSEVSVSPTAVDAFVPIDDIKVNGRHRSDLGDIDALAASIADVDLLNPVTLTRDGRLVAGERRLAACRRLGWTQVPARFVDRLADAARLLRAERDENTCRKDMLPSELAALGAALEEIERPVAAARMRNGARRGLAARYGLAEGTGTPDQSAKVGKTTEAVGEALGLAGRTYQELAYVHRIAADEDAPAEERDLAAQTLAEMDRTGAISPNARRLRGRLRHKREVAQVVAAVIAQPQPEPVEDDLTPPPRSSNTREAAEQRLKIIRYYAARGYSSGQMGDKLNGLIAETIRRYAREANIPIPADEVLGKSRKRIDSNRIVRETVQTVEDLGTALNLVNFAELDTAEIPHWTASLSESIRMLNRLNKQLRERAQ